MSKLASDRWDVGPERDKGQAGDPKDSLTSEQLEDFGQSAEG